MQDKNRNFVILVVRTSAIAVLEVTVQERPDKQSRKAKLREWRARQRVEARSKLPTSDEKLRALFDELDQVLPKQGCDHSLRLVHNWALAHEVDIDALTNWCRDNGGNCDCEVLANCEERWEEARRDVNP